MEERILKFIAALRAGGVRISLSESTDAFRAIESLGIKQRELFRLSLQSTLVKEARDLPVFDELFRIFFGSAEQLPMANLTDDLAPDEVEMLAQALHDYNQSLRQMIDKLIKGEQLSPDELENLAKLVGLNQVDEMRYREWMVQRMKRALHFKEIQEALQELVEILAEMGMDKARVAQIQNLLQANQNALEDQLHQFAGQRIAENLSERPPAGTNIDHLLNRPFSTLNDSDMDLLRQEVQRLAVALKTRLALRQKHAHSGKLDAKATIRANLKHGSTPIELKYRERTLKPRLVVICDVSSSMRSCSELMLSLLYALQDLISKTYSFAFIDHLSYISPDFVGQSASAAVAQVLQRNPTGYYNTDLGGSLLDFYNDYLDTLDRRTTFIVVGDGRNNYNNPRLDLFSLIARRSRKVIWLTPEPPMLWGSGDSDMLQYAAGCDAILQAGTLAELTIAVDKLLQG